MHLRRGSDRVLLTLDDVMIGQGGEAGVFGVRGSNAVLAKVYHHPSPLRARKLLAMLNDPPSDPMAIEGHASIAWPQDLLLRADRADVVGFLMPRVANMRPIFDFYIATSRQQHQIGFNPRYLLQTARNLAAAIHALHGRGYVIGDVNESNILVARTALVTLVDTDSFQVPDPRGGVMRCPVGKPEYTPPELQGQHFADVDRNTEHDLFGLAVLLFKLLMEGAHPFDGRFTGSGDPPQLEERIQQGHFPHHRSQRVPYQPMLVAPPLGMLHPRVRELFCRCFEDGHRRPQARPSAQTWLNALDEASRDLQVCRANSQHFHGSHLSSCPWCERARSFRRDPFPAPQNQVPPSHLRALSAQRPLPPPTPQSFRPIRPVPPPMPGQPPRRASPPPPPARVPSATTFQIHPVRVPALPSGPLLPHQLRLFAVAVAGTLLLIYLFLQTVRTPDVATARSPMNDRKGALVPPSSGAPREAPIPRSEPAARPSGVSTSAATGHPNKPARRSKRERARQQLGPNDIPNF